ncbi:tail fiber assembly protein [Escherichia coli]|nr:putative phage tail fiber assembly protein [Escherichia coli O157:H43 str. T22]
MKYFTSAPIALYNSDISSYIPGDGVEISDEVYDALIAGQEAGKNITADSNGLPVLAEPAQPTHDELVAASELMKQHLIDAAMASISLIQLKLQAGRKLTQAETTRLNAVLDYIDAVTATDTSTAPDVIWPELPEA